MKKVVFLKLLLDISLISGTYQMTDGGRARPQSPDPRLNSKKGCDLNVSMLSKGTTFLAIQWRIKLAVKLPRFENSVIQLEFMYLKVSYQNMVPVQVCWILYTVFLDRMGM